MKIEAIRNKIDYYIFTVLVISSISILVSIRGVGKELVEIDRLIAKMEDNEKREEQLRVIMKKEMDVVERLSIGMDVFIESECSPKKKKG